MSRTQPERSAATQQALQAAARALWGERGYAAVGTPEIAKAAGVTRGAMYHQYADKAALFRAVLEIVETEVFERLATRVTAREPATPVDAIKLAAQEWLEIAQEPEIRQLLVVDGPTVLGWTEFRDIAQRYGLGRTEQILTSAIDAGQLRPLPVRALAAAVLAAIDEAVMYVADAPDPVVARSDALAVIDALLDGLRTG